MNNLRKRWIKALRSGKYIQGFTELESDGKHCCLGVLCRVIQPTDSIEHLREGQYLKASVCELVGITDEDQIRLAVLNDERVNSFESIATLLEHIPDGL